MASISSVSLVHTLRHHGLLEPGQLQELPALHARFPDPKALARELIQRGWLTPYQANQLLQGKAQELVLGSYILLERLGEGGMGQVFKARHRNLGRTVAVKLIRKERLDNPDAIKRFEREVRAAAALNHPNIVRAYDADQIGGTYLLVMECVEGATDLGRLVKKNGPLPTEQACEYVRQAALGLQHAYERGLVHRDIKPHNLLLTADGKAVKVLDMGLARLDHPGADDDRSSTMTQEGAVMGTPDYIAPEQAIESHTVDIRGDLYSLGCTFYYLLTGKPPFPGGTLAEKLVKHQLQEPTPVEQLRSDVSPRVAAVVRMLMAKRPEDRYQTPGQLARVLAELLHPAPPAADLSVPEDRTVPWEGTPRVGANWSAVVAPSSRTEVLAGAERVRPGTRRRTWLLAGAGAVTVLGGVILWAALAGKGSPGRDREGEPEQPGRAGVGGGPGAPKGEPQRPRVAAGDFFNGKDFTGWEGLTDRFWSVKDGAIVGSTFPDGNKFNTFLCSKKKYKDFELKFKVKLTGKGWSGNSGVQIRSEIRDVKTFAVTGPQCDMGDDYWGSLYGENFGGMMKAADKDEVARALKKGDFNDYSIRCVGKHVTIQLNGVTTVDDDFEKLPAEGIIAWQLHAGKAMEVHFKDIEFKELTAPPAGVGTSPPPKGALVLFNGKDLDEWVQVSGTGRPTWEVLNDGSVEVRKGNIMTRRKFEGTFRLHVEFLVPLMPNARGQARGNSGVYVQGRYEIQILDSYGLNATKFDCGAIYGVAAPRVNACRPPGKWQSFDIEFHAPPCTDGRRVGPARMTLLHNGVKIHDDIPINVDSTAGALGGGPCTAGSIMLQEHGARVRFRNIWLVPGD
jgi:serine/threonine protein kinase